MMVCCFRVVLLLDDGRRVAAEVVAIDLGHDLALLRSELSVAPAGLAIAGCAPRPTTRVYHFGPAPRRRIMILTGEGDAE